MARICPKVERPHSDTVQQFHTGKDTFGKRFAGSERQMLHGMRYIQLARVLLVIAGLDIEI